MCYDGGITINDSAGNRYWLIAYSCYVPVLSMLATRMAYRRVSPINFPSFRIHTEASTDMLDCDSASVLTDTYQPTGLT